MFRLAPRLLAVAGLTTLAVAVTAGPAMAHVSVDAPDATQGGFTVVSFRVPTESETASTTGLKVQLPADQPLAFVSVKPKAGWTYTTQTAKLATPIESDDGQVTEAVSVIDWKAASPAAGIKPGEFDEFQISVGPLPKAASMAFKAIQTYSDGKQVAWIDEPAPGSTAEPEHPAPTLTLAAAAAETGGASPSPTASAATGTGTATTTPAAAADDVSTGAVIGAYVVGGAGLLAGLAGLALAARRRRATVVDVKQQSVGAGAE